MQITDGCMSCGMCAEVCEHGAIQPIGGSYSGYHIIEELCIDCGICLEVDCPGECIC